MKGGFTVDLGGANAFLPGSQVDIRPVRDVGPLMNIVQQAENRWSLQAARVVHRVGKMYPGDQIVLVLTASAHRGDAYEANTFIMDYLKTEAPFWKKEWTPEGPRWIEARDSDDDAAARWGAKPPASNP